MNDKIRRLNKAFCVEKPRVLDAGSRARANEKLRWFLNEILFAETWIHHPYNKILVGYDIIDQLEREGFPWQAERIRNHLHRWMKSISCKDPRDHADMERVKSAV